MSDKNYTSKKRLSNNLSNGEKFVSWQEHNLLSESLTFGGIVKDVNPIDPIWRDHILSKNVSIIDTIDNVDIFDNVVNLHHVDIVGGMQDPQPSGADPASPLSTVHKSPFIEYCDGASLLKVSKSEPCKPPLGGKRGRVDGFSNSSRRRLMQTIAKVKRDADLPCFVTLTYPNEFPSPKESKRHLDIFIKRLKRRFDVGGIWKLEPQERGAPHYHILVWGASVDDLGQYIPWTWFEIAGNGDKNHLYFHAGMLNNKPCVQEVRSFRGVWSYAAKYLGKTFTVAGWDNQETGRFWAVFNRHLIPFGEVKIIEITKSKAVHIMRYQKRYAQLKRRNYPSLSTYCDVNQWINNVMVREVKQKK